MNLSKFLLKFAPISITCTPRTHALHNPPLALLLFARHLHVWWTCLSSVHTHTHLWYATFMFITLPPICATALYIAKRDTCMSDHTPWYEQWGSAYTHWSEVEALRPSWAAQCSMVNPLWSVLCSEDSIPGARYWIVLIWPPSAATWRAFCPS